MSASNGVHKDCTNGVHTNGSATKSRSSGSSKKDSSPFRVKIGCVVAIRQRVEGNNVAIKRNSDTLVPIQFDNYVSVWTDPLPRRDEGLALIGKRIRCHVPKMTKEQKHRVLEGEVIGLPDYRAVDNSNTLQYRPTIKIELLVDRKAHAAFPFIKRIDEDVDVSALPNEKAKRNYLTEQKLKGNDKVIVKIPKLAHPSCMDSAKNALKWSILKHVPVALLSGKSNGNKKVGANGDTDHARFSPTKDILSETDSHRDDNSEKQTPLTNSGKKRKRESTAIGVVTKHLGDGSDGADRQVANWRWACSRYHDYIMYHNRDQVDSTSAEILSMGFIGQVTGVNVNTESSSLASVTLRRFYLPEHTAAGRTTCHGAQDMFSDAFSSSDAENDHYLLQVPIEQLIVMYTAADLVDITNFASSSGGMYKCDSVAAMYKYDFAEDLYSSTNATETDMVDMLVCHRCHKLSTENDKGELCTSKKCPWLVLHQEGEIWWCEDCLQQLGGKDVLPCCSVSCDCRFCTESHANEVHNKCVKTIEKKHTAVKKDSVDLNAIQHASLIMSSMEECHFSIPSTINSAKISSKPLERPAQRSRTKSIVNLKARSKKNGSATDDHTANGGSEETRRMILDRITTHNGEMTCAKLLSNDKIKQVKSYNMSYVSHVSEDDLTHNLRQSKVEVAAVEVEKEEKSSGRASRALQRNVMKDVVAIGADGLSIGTLAKREPQLRFDRSRIHAWGVFADEDIQKGELVIEYRGILISNAMAEKREKEYEAAKIGSDYMFRIDGAVVCDATKDGNVARFINASCDPNCVSKIIGLDGEKRIAIYAKRNISLGEELCYDYKFSLEYDESKRIPCHCGAKDCRGFMNWDKRYTTSPTRIPDANDNSKLANVRSVGSNEETTTVQP